MERLGNRLLSLFHLGKSETKPKLGKLFNEMTAYFILGLMTFFNTMENAGPHTWYQMAMWYVPWLSINSTSSGSGQRTKLDSSILKMEQFQRIILLYRNYLKISVHWEMFGMSSPKIMWLLL